MLDKLVIAHLSRTIWLIFSSFFIFCFYFTRLKAPEIEKLGKYWPYCTRNRVITNVNRLMKVYNRNNFLMMK